MSVRKKIEETNGVFFITFTCARWLPLFAMANGYAAVYTWSDWLKQNGHQVAGHVIMPSHVHALIAFRTTETPISTIIGNGKRFMAYEIVKLLRQQNRVDVLEQLSAWVNTTQRLQQKKHEVFEPSSDKKECFSLRFMDQKANYIHYNPCKEGLVKLPEEYVHSSAKYYITGEQGVYPVITYMELQDIDLTSAG